MTYATGIALAFVAMLGWGFGDFFIQRSARKMGDWETLFLITLLGSIVLSPFVFNDVIELFESNNYQTIFAVILCCLILFIAALLDLEALKEGKLSIVEPIWSFEIVMSATAAFVVIGEKLDLYQILIIALLIIGLFLVSVREKGYLKIKTFLVEKGVFIAFIAASMMGVANFLFGWSARMTSPILINFVTNVFMAVASLIFIMFRGGIKKMFRDVSENPVLAITMSISDNIAWVAFGFAMVLAPIGIAVALSESYIIIAVILGFLINHEKIQTHQKFGLVIAVIAAIALATITA